jgi:alanyl-tRNA synthetase
VISGTVVTYPDGETTSTGTVLQVTPLGDGRSAVVLDVTAFHPVDTAWPDQPADRGSMRFVDGREVPIVDAVVGASDGGDFVFGTDVPVRTGADGWTFVVAHVVEGSVPVGEQVSVEADATYRTALSRGHTACHLASLALDAALAGAWKKDTPLDALGMPAFDALAIQESRIHPDGSRDVYRIGKSLRRKGFDPAALDDLPALSSQIDALLAEWVAAGGDVRIDRDGRTLADRRTWVCTLPDAEARIPCGGTHVASLAELGSVGVELVASPVEGGIEVVMTTTATAAR